MLVHIIWVKEDSKPTDGNLDNEEQQVVRHNIDILIESSDIIEARRVLESWGVIMVSIKEYPQNENTFWKIYLKAKCDWKSIRVINFMDDLHDAAVLFCNVGLDIEEINYLNNPEPATEAKNILEDAKIYVNDQNKRIKEMMDKKKKQKDNVFANKWLIKIRLVIDDVIDRWADIVERTVWIVDGKKLKKFKELKGELSKLKMGTNEIKIASSWEEYLNLMEDIELEFLEKKKG